MIDAIIHLLKNIHASDLQLCLGDHSMPTTPSFSLSCVSSSFSNFSCPLCPKSVPLVLCQQEQHEQHHGFDVTWLNHQDCWISQGIG